MGKRIGANERKRKTERTGRNRAGLLRSLLIGTALLAVCGGGAVAYGTYRDRLPDLRNLTEIFRETKVDSITITGAIHLTSAEIMKRCGIRLPIAFGRLKHDCVDAIRATSPWIDTVEFSRTHESAVTIVIRERRPVAMLQTVRPGKVALVDSHGVCMPIDPHVSLDLPLVSGLTDSVAEGGVRMLTKGNLRRMVRLFGEAALFDSSFARRITQANFTPFNTVRLVLTGSPTMVVIDEGDISGRLQRYRQLREAVADDSLPPARIDLSYRDLAFVTVRSRPAAEAAATKKKRG